MNSEYTKIIEPKNQLNLYGYKNYFDTFKLLFKKKKLPKIILLTGKKGLGKSTFAYHFANYLLSLDEKDEYIYSSFSINPNNLSYKSIQNNTHPNFFALDKESSEVINIEQTRNLLKFLNKTVINKNIKIVLLDNVEYLNLNSSNALLKSIEEPPKNTYFFIINNESKKILKTITSRCINFKFHFDNTNKKMIFFKIIKNYKLNFSEDDIEEFLFFDTHGNLLRYLIELKELNVNISQNCLSCIDYFIEQYRKKSDQNLLNYISIFIEYFYKQLSNKNISNINYYYNNKNKILNLITDMSKFHLDKKNFLFSIDQIIKNEA